MSLCLNSFLPKWSSFMRLMFPTSSLMVISSTRLWFSVNCCATSISLETKKARVNLSSHRKLFIKNTHSKYKQKHEVASWLVSVTTLKSIRFKIFHSQLFIHLMGNLLANSLPSRFFFCILMCNQYDYYNQSAHISIRKKSII